MAKERAIEVGVDGMTGAIKIKSDSGPVTNGNGPMVQFSNRGAVVLSVMKDKLVYWAVICDDTGRPD